MNLKLNPLKLLRPLWRRCVLSTQSCTNAFHASAKTIDQETIPTRLMRDPFVNANYTFWSPPNLLESSPPLPTLPPNLKWSKDAVCCSFIAQQGSTISDYLQTLDYHLLNRRRTNIFVPDADDGHSPVGYIESQIIRPLICFTNDLRMREELAKIFYNVEPTDGSFPIRVQICMEKIITGFVGDYSKHSFMMPVFLFYPASFFAPLTGTNQSTVPIPKTILDGMHESAPLVLTDFVRVFVATKRDVLQRKIFVELTTTQQASLRSLLASCIVKSLPRYHFDLRIVDYFFPRGAPNDPSLPEPSDQEVFATRRCHADFDRYVLDNSPSAIPQFLRWKEKMKSKKRVKMEGDVLVAKSHAFSLVRAPFEPRYPLEPLPQDTTAHLADTRRSVFPEFTKLLEQSASFNVELLEELSPRTGTGYARTFVARILQVDGEDVTIDLPSKLCLKIYDDSFGNVINFSSVGCSSTVWLQEFYTAAEMIQNEENVYLRLRHAWGSVLPFYYGTHLIACQDGQYRYGMLMEFIPRASKPLQSYPEASQVSFIQSARHALRVLQYADITQTDWSSRQLIVTAVPSPDICPAFSCTLIDFALAKQGDVFYDVYKEDDYNHLAASIVADKFGNESGCKLDLIRRYYGPPEQWDFAHSSLDTLED